MWTNRLFGKSARMERTEEPVALQRVRAMESELSARSLAMHEDQLDDVYAHDTILGLLGSHLDDGNFSSEREDRVAATSMDGGDLLGSLYAHYCRALDTPQSLMSGAWVPSSLPARAHADPKRDGAENDTSSAISDMFEDIECIDQAFGALKPDTFPDMHEPDAVPEILRLFAPPEYKAKARVETFVTPALTQREHQTLAIDSPLMGLNDANRKTETGNQ